MQARQLNFGWDQEKKSWFGMVTNPVTIAEVVEEGYELLKNPHET